MVYNVALVLTTLLSVIVAGFFAALKYYSNTIGSNPENFDLNKLAPILIISVAVSIGMYLGAGTVIEQEALVDFITANFLLVIFANTGWTILVKKYPSLGQLFSSP